MGAWGNKPWDNDAAADWFAGTFAGIDLDARVEDAFADPDDFDAVRAACYLLAVLGRTYVWPGDIERLDSHLERGITLLAEMLEPGSELRELSDDDPELLAEVRSEIAELAARLDGDEDDDDDDEEDEDDEDLLDLDDDEEDLEDLEDE